MRWDVQALDIEHQSLIFHFECKSISTKKNTRTFWLFNIEPLALFSWFLFWPLQDLLLGARFSDSVKKAWWMLSFDYSYNNFRVTSMQAVINETPLPIDLCTIRRCLWWTEQFGKFSVINYDLNQVLTTTVMKHTQDLQRQWTSHWSPVWNPKNIAYWMTIQYDNMGEW